MPATEEQQAICQSQAQVVKIKAGAGTGKTTTLRGLAQRNPQAKMLYLAFNRAIKDEATAKFSGNVKAMTAHGLAFARVGKNYANQPDKLASGDLKPFHIQDTIANSLSKMPAALGNLYGGRVIETIKNFLVSPDPAIDAQHLVLPAAASEKKHFQPQRMLADAVRVWEQMQSLQSKVPMVHDGYLKMFQLEAPRLWYDMILLDEAQDTNPVTQALVEAQNGRRIYVGDEHQAIYAFRGAQNAMAVPADEEYLLTGSFRFGKAIADMANLLLAAKGEDELRLRGLGGPSTVGTLAPKTPHAYIARGNSALFARAVQAMEESDSFAFVGPLFNYRFDLIEQTYRMSLGEKVKDAFLSSFKDYTELEEYAEAMEDREIMGRCKIVSRYGRRIPFLVSQIQSKAMTTTSAGNKPMLTLTSAHRSKGLEFDHVVMADDFMDFFDEESSEWKDLSKADRFQTEEVNLQYVAATRARKQLEIGEKLTAFVVHELAKQAKANAQPTNNSRNLPSG